MNAQQARFRYEHKRLCMERAIERCDYDAASVFCAQAAYFARIIDGQPLTTENRNDPTLAEPSENVGCNCRPEIDRGVVYGGDMVDVF